MIESDKVTS